MTREHLLELKVKGREGRMRANAISIKRSANLFGKTQAKPIKLADWPAGSGLAFLPSMSQVIHHAADLIWCSVLRCAALRIGAI